VKRYLFISSSGDSLPIAYRLWKEGNDVAVYIHNPRYRHNYDGMIPKATLKTLPRIVREKEAFVFDMVAPVEHKRDRALHKVFGVKGDSLFGPIADTLRKQGKAIIGSSRFTDKMELDRQLGSTMVQKLGLHTPRSKAFNSLSAGAAFLRKAKGLWAFKPFENQDLDLTYVEKYPGELVAKLENEYPQRLPDGTGFLLQEKIDGVEISTEAWWNGSEWGLFNHTIEDKTLMNDNLGPRIGSATNTVWLKQRRGLLNDVFEALTPIVQSAGYAGPVDINAIVGQGGKKTYFLEWTPRLGYDAIYCLLSLLEDPIGQLIEYVAGGSKKPQLQTGQFGSSIRVSIPPYPYENPELLELAQGIQISGAAEDLWLEDVKQERNLNMVCAGSDGVIGVAAASGRTIKESVNGAYAKAKAVQIGAYPQYRTDAGQRAEKARATLKRWGIEVD